MSEKIDWIPRLDQHDLLKLYRRYELFLFPSLHDSGGMVVLEAMAHDLPVVCLDLGGPGTMVDDTCGRVISTRHASRARVIEQLGHALIEIAENQDLRHSLTAAALARVREYIWKAVVGRVYSTRRSVLRIEDSAKSRVRCL